MQQQQSSSTRGCRRHHQLSKLCYSRSSIDSSIRSLGSKENSIPRSSPVEWLDVTRHNLDDGLDTEVLSTNEDDVQNHCESSWQEEAHWMSFRSAVQQLVASCQVTTKEHHQEDILTACDDQRTTIVQRNSDEDDDSGVLVGVPRHVLLLKSPTDYTWASNASGQHNLDDSASSLASDLAIGISTSRAR